VTTPTLASLLVAAAFAAGDWVARLRQSALLEYVCKPATLAALAAAAVTLTPAHDAGARRWWFVAALLCSLAGDVLLMLPSDRFVAGLAAFLVGHLCYVAGFWSHGPAAVTFALTLVVVAVVLTPLGHRILRQLRGRRALGFPVTLYMVVIAVMLATALSTANAPAGVGAVLFVGSDAMIAWNRFVRPFRHADVGIMVTYHLGQAGLVLSLLHS